MDDKLLFLLSKAENKLKNHFQKKINDQNIKLSPGQSGILFLLNNNDGLKMSELSKLLGIDNSAVTRLVDRLEKAGMVKRKANSADRRQYLICITKKGRQDIKRVGIIANQTNDIIKEGFTVEEIETFKKVLYAFISKF